MELPFRARDISGGSSRHRHQSSSSTSFRRTSHHAIDLTSPVHDTPRQANLLLDFIIVGAGLSYA